MWQVLLAAAAAAGSGILAKKLINPADTEKPISDLNQVDQSEHFEPQDSSLQFHETFQESSNKGIFRFSSSKTGSFKGLGKNNRRGFRMLKKNGDAKRGKKCGILEFGEKEINGIGSGRRISVCLKKRRTGKHSAGRCESCAAKDNSFGRGVGVGIMYMMSSGKAEISKLNCAMEETAKTVQELKAEISKRKNEAVLTPIDVEIKNKVIASGPSLNEDGIFARNVVTEYQQQPEVLEMDQLEAELVSELQKLPSCATEGSTSEGRVKTYEADVLTKEHQASEDIEKSDMYKYNGVSPEELDEKLCHLLIGQQESQIVELESELHQAHSKLQEKEAELQALKDCVKRLTEFSLASASDDEPENHNDNLKMIDGIEELGFESRKSSVGMKRTMGYESNVCSAR